MIGGFKGVLGWIFGRLKFLSRAQLLGQVEIVVRAACIGCCRIFGGGLK
jgi:hypothetical protein